MAKVKFNVKGVDSKTSANLPKPGLYTCKVVSCVAAKPDGKDLRLEVQYEIQDKEYKGFKLYDYVNLESEAARWKLKQFLEAMGVAKDSGQFDPAEFVGTALTIKVKIQAETDQYAASARPQTLLPLDGAEGSEDEEDLEDEDDESEDEDDESEDDDEDDDEDEDEDDDDDAWDEESLADLDNDELKEAAEELDVAVPKKLTAASKKKLIAAILEAQEGDDDEDEDEDEDDEDDEEVDYSSMELAELKKLCKERELATKGSKAALIKRLEKSDDPF